MRQLHAENESLSAQVRKTGGALPPLKVPHVQERARRDPKAKPLFQDLLPATPIASTEFAKVTPPVPTAPADPAGEAKPERRSSLPVFLPDRTHRQAHMMPLPLVPNICSDGDAGGIADGVAFAGNEAEDDAQGLEPSQQQARGEQPAAESSQQCGEGQPPTAPSVGIIRPPSAEAICDERSPSVELKVCSLPNCLDAAEEGSDKASEKVSEKGSEKASEKSPEKEADKASEKAASSKNSSSSSSDEESSEDGIERPKMTPMTPVSRLTSETSIGQVLPIWLPRRQVRPSIFDTQQFGFDTPKSSHTISAFSSAPKSSRLRKTETRMIGELRDKMGGFQRFCSKRTLRPNSRMRLVWDFCGMALVTYDLIVVPLGAFGHFENAFTRVMSWMTTIFWMLDIPCSFMTGFHVDGIVELRPVVIARRYAQTWLTFDLVVVCVDLLISMITLSRSGAMADGEVEAARLGRALRFLRLFRLLRLLKVSGFIDELCQRLKSDYLLIMLGILKLLVFIIVINHLLACSWYGIGTLDMTRDDTWVIENRLQHAGLSYRYFTALHWSITQFTPASMEVVPENNIERGFTVCVILFAMVTFSSFISTITAAMTQLRNLDSDTIEKMTRLRQYLAQNKISADLTCRVWGCLKAAMAKDSKRIYATEVPLLALLPWHVKLDLRDQVFRPMLSVHPFFQHFSCLHHAEQDKIYQTALAEFFHGPGQEVFCAADSAEKMYFVVSGELKFSQDLMEDTVVSHGGWVSEPVLWMHWRHTGRLISQTRCELIGLEAGSAQKILKLFDEPAKYARAFAKFCQQHPDRITDTWVDPELLERIAETAFTKPKPITLQQILPAEPSTDASED